MVTKKRERGEGRLWGKILEVELRGLEGRLNMMGEEDTMGEVPA